MPRVSKIPVEKKKMDQFFEDFWEAIASLGTKQEARGFFFDLLTHTERKMLAKRFQIAILLLEGNAYKAISEQVKVSETTIARINNWLNTGAGELIRVARLIGKKDENANRSPEKPSGKYMAGDLLLPAVEEGARILSRRLKRKAK